MYIMDIGRGGAKAHPIFDPRFDPRWAQYFGFVGPWWPVSADLRPGFRFGKVRSPCWYGQASKDHNMGFLIFVDIGIF